MRPLLILTLPSVLLTTCRVTLPPDSAKYFCTTAADCGDVGWLCATAPGAASGYCCLPSGPEVCDGIDNDCNGIVDDTGKAEICNGIDDNCDGQVDEGFDLQSDAFNCGTCNHVCDPRDVCVAGACTLQGEINCGDGVDNDGNGLTDCADPSCSGRACGGGCTCQNLHETESACADGVDNDGDGLIDCLDPDCQGAECGPGCACAPDGGFAETICNDDLDDDHDGLIDCADPDCEHRLCGTAEVPFTCNAGACNCNGGAQVIETGELCGDRIDNDCNGKTDCADPNCDGQPCNMDGGSCSAGACR